MLRAFFGRPYRASSQLAYRTYGSELPVAKVPAASSHATGSAQDSPGEGSEFWRQLDVLEQPKPGPQVFDRWDWHAGQLLVALIPAAAIYALAMWARKDMARVEKELLKKLQSTSQMRLEECLFRHVDSWDATPDASSTQSLRSFTASMQRKEKAAQNKEAMAESRIDAVEQLVRDLQAEMQAHRTQQMKSQQKPEVEATGPAQAALEAAPPPEKRGG